MLRFHAVSRGAYLGRMAHWIVVVWQRVVVAMPGALGVRVGCWSRRVVPRQDFVALKGFACGCCKADPCFGHLIL